jgi:Transglutaminase-like superfamily
LLGRRGIPSRVVIGVRTSPEFAAHAWVEQEGLPLLPTDGYVPLHQV